jgi:hypothetical protein
MTVRDRLRREGLESFEPPVSREEECRHQRTVGGSVIQAGFSDLPVSHNMTTSPESPVNCRNPGKIGAKELADLRLKKDIKRDD